MEEILTLVYKTYGIVGIILFAPIVACVYLWRENKNIHGATARQIQASNDKVAAALQQRVVDAQSITNKLVEIVSEQASSNRETNLALERLESRLAALKTRS
jgi:NACalpha-BTF3-like transcription factor